MHLKEELYVILLSEKKISERNSLFGVILWMFSIGETFSYYSIVIPTLPTMCCGKRQVEQAYRSSLLAKWAPHFDANNILCVYILLHKVNLSFQNISEDWIWKLENARNLWTMQDHKDTITYLSLSLYDEYSVRVVHTF